MDQVFRWIMWFSTLLGKLLRKFSARTNDRHSSNHQNSLVLDVSHLHDHDNNHINLLPDEIITDILSRLDIECAHLCRDVCTRFHNLISTPSFISTHLNRNQGKPTIVVQCYTQLCYSFSPNENHPNIPGFYKCKMPLRFIDDEGSKNPIVRMKTKFNLNYWPSNLKNMPHLIASYNGFLLFSCQMDGALIIFNPITKEQLLVNFPGSRHELCGFYFHVPTCEYRILYMFFVPYECCTFFVCSLKNNKLLREISNHTGVIPCNTRSPIILNGALHWMASTYVGEPRSCIMKRTSVDCSNSILVFKMDSEEFMTMPHPGSQCDSIERHTTRTYLLEMEGQLCFCDISCPATDEQLHDAKLYVWVLKDFTQQIWVRKYVVTLSDINISKFNNEDHRGPYVQVLHIHNNEVFLRKGRRKLFCYHLILDTFRKVDMGPNLKRIESLVVHTHTLISLHMDMLGV